MENAAGASLCNGKSCGAFQTRALEIWAVRVVGGV